MKNLIINKPTAEQNATAGPIAGKSPLQAAAHRMVVLRNSWLRLDTTWQHWQERLSDIKRDRVWEYYPEGQPYGSLVELLKANNIDPDFALRQDDPEIALKLNQDQAGALAALLNAKNRPTALDPVLQDLQYQLGRGKPPGAVCAVCGKPLDVAPTGRPRMYCSAACKQAAVRRRRLARLRGDR